MRKKRRSDQSLAPSAAPPAAPEATEGLWAESDAAATDGDAPRRSSRADKPATC